MSFYTSRLWTAELKPAVMKRDPLCRICNRWETTHVDHIIPRERGGADALYNLQGTCRNCHNKKIALLDGGFGNAPFDPARLKPQEVKALAKAGLTLAQVVRAIEQGYWFDARQVRVSGAAHCKMMRAVLHCYRTLKSRVALWPPSPGKHRKSCAKQIGTEWTESFDGSWTDRRQQLHVALKVANTLNALGRKASFAGRAQGVATAKVGEIPPPAPP